MVRGVSRAKRSGQGAGLNEHGKRSRDGEIRAESKEVGE